MSTQTTSYPDFENPLDFAPVLFTTNSAGISRPWGTTGITLGGIKRASIMLVASELPGQPWLLIKSDGLMLIQRLTPDTTDLYPSNDPEAVMVMCISGFLHRIHFPHVASYWAFRYLALYGGSAQERERSVIFSYPVLMSAWDQFTVPFDYPRIINHVL
ncbi:hypothetical protein BJ138DRAFT_1116125 [Hygrophoropsis aurantiaca]|uniref:Uncharacterized protein n=1 Tax=Hygrophoropsis aurantiaca TaxID=72124 RepID=A0ACB8A4G0_9AGAM|nr:hypothetical protein BJ138DRAFT_1116125 [Hygrophoropsis aurantiaca]